MPRMVVMACAAFTHRFKSTCSIWVGLALTIFNI